MDLALGLVGIDGGRVLTRDGWRETGLRETGTLGSLALCELDEERLDRGSG